MSHNINTNNINISNNEDSDYVPIFTAQSRNKPSVLNIKTPHVIESFKRAFPGHTPDFITRSPGRVNLIGEHIDYSDFSVLPMAIEVDMCIAVKIIPNDSKNPSITLINIDPQFAQRKFDLPLDGEYVTIDPSVSDWSNYFKCGLLVAHTFLKKNYPTKFNNLPLVGLEVFCLGDVPVGSGLSSSTAFICAVALAIIKANMGLDHPVSKTDLLQITITAEHYVGVNNGGMDQATSICGQEGHALYVQFKPTLTATPFKFPELISPPTEIQFVIANTLVVANKFETGPINYNLRVVEVIVAANVLASMCGVALSFDSTSDFQKGNLRDFMNAYFITFSKDKDPWNGDVENGIIKLTKMLELVEEKLGPYKDTGFTVSQAAMALGCSNEEFTRNYLTIVPIRFQVLKLYQRAKHVFSEALRVLEAVKVIMRDGQDFHTSLDFFQQFGTLMNQSQESCNKLFECSTLDINQLCQIALQNGSYGSRLTGAGWGGCTVHLVPGPYVDQVKNALIEQYYKKRYPNITQYELDNAIIVSKPASGTCEYIV